MNIPGNLLTTAMAVMPHTDVGRALETALSLIFSRSAVFVGIEADKQTEIFSLGRRCVYEPGAVLFREGGPAAKSYLLLNGRIKLSRLHQDGKEAIVRYINPGEMTAAVSVFNGKDYPVTARSVGPSEVVGWNRQAMLVLMAAYPQIPINLLGMVILCLDDIQNP